MTYKRRGSRRRKPASLIMDATDVSVHVEQTDTQLRGKSTAEALEYLHQIIETTEASRQIPILSSLKAASAVAAIACGSIFIVLYTFAPTLSSLLTSGLLLYLSAAATFSVALFDIYLCNTEVKRRLKPAKLFLQTIAENAGKANVNDSLSKSFNTSFQTVLRDSRWVLIPNVALVPGDLVQIRDGMLAPCGLEVISSSKTKKSKRKLNKGDFVRLPSAAVPPVVPVNQFSESAHLAESMPRIAGCPQKNVLRVLECPFSERMSDLTGPTKMTRPKNTLFNQKRAIQRRFRQFSFAGFAVAFLRTAFVMFSRWTDLSVEVMILLVHEPIVCVLASFCLSETVFSFLVDAVGNGILIQTDIDLQQARPQDSAIGLGPNKLQSLSILWKQRRATFNRIIYEVFGLGTALTRLTNPFEVLGQITAVCALDKDGIVSEVFSAPEHVLVWDNGTPVVLDLIADHDMPNRVIFERNWEQHFDAVKPLGLSCLMGASCAESVELVGVKPSKLVELNHASGSSEYDVVVRDQEIPSECLCQIGREVGFAADFAIRSFQQLQQIHVICPSDNSASLGVTRQDAPRLQLLPHMSSKVVKSAHSEMLQLFSRGDPNVVLSYCDYVWNKTQPLPFSGPLKKKTLDILHHWAHVDFKCFAFAYSPISPYASSYFNEANHEATVLFSSLANMSNLPQELDPVNLEMHDMSWADPHVISDMTQACNEAVKGQILLGIVASRPPPKPEMPYIIEDLMKAGIRFVFFSATGRRKSIAFTSKLGLESDWNFFISLKDRSSEPSQSVEAALNISKLPEGISKIRDHIESVDNVPLLVSLFTDSTPDTTREMISILQENGESVLCIGSSLNDSNFRTFLQSDAAISVDPRIDDDHSRRGRAPVQTEFYFSFAKHIISLPCPFMLSSSTNIRTYLAGLISQSRNLLMHSNQAYIFYVACLCSTLILSTLSLVVGLPCVFEAYQVLSLIWISIPIVSCSLLFSPSKRLAMQVIMEKNIVHLSSIDRFTCYFCLRFLPSTCFCLALYSHILSRSIPNSTYFAWSIDPRIYLRDSSTAGSIHHAKAFTLFAFVYCLLWLSMGFLYRNDSIIRRNPFRNVIWILACAVVLSFQLLMTSSSLASMEKSILLFPVLALISWPIVIISVDEAVKWHDRISYHRHQQRLRILFDTRLGMHSPK